MKKIIFVISFIVLSGFLFGFSTPDAQAATVAELQTQIQQLLAQIAALQQQLAQLQGGPVIWCHTFNVNLKIGDTGPEVTALQTALSKEGLYTRGVTGTFDEYTASAVVAFQEKYASEVLAPWGLTHGTGFVGTTTRAKLNKLYGCGVVRPYIKVISPNGGERWVVGSTYEIKWSCPEEAGVELIEIFIADRRKDEAPISGGMIGCSTEKYSWKIGDWISPGENSFKIQLRHTAGAQSVIDESDNYFSIVSATTPTTCSALQLSSSAAYYFNLCKNEGYDKICFNKYTSVFQGCGKSSYNGCTLHNVNAAQNIWCDTGMEKPSLTVISPNGGETWVIGKTYSVVWQSKGVDTVSVNLYDPYTGHTYGLVSNIPASQGKYSWTISSIIPESSTYRIQVSGSYKGSAFDQSDNYFSIASPTYTCTDSDGGNNIYVKGTVESPTTGQGGTDCCAIKTTTDPRPSCTKFVTGKDEGNSVWEYICADNGGVMGYLYSCPSGYTCSEGACAKEEPVTVPSITVVSPNGGEQWMAGQAYTIKWKSENLPSNAQLLIRVKRDDGGIIGITNYLSPQQTEYKWQIDLNKLLCWSWGAGCVEESADEILRHKFKIEVVGYWPDPDKPGYNLTVEDGSDNYFNIVSPASTCTDSDGGRDYFIKGTVTRCEAGVGGALGECQEVTDTCVDSTVLKEYYCENGLIKSVSYTCSYGCKDGACQAGITVISPDGGEKWEAGKTYYISWASEGTNYSSVYVNIYLWKDGGFVKTIALGVSPSTLGGSPSIGKYSWTIPSGLTVSDRYKIRLYASGIAKSDISDGYFSIVEAGTPVGLEYIENRLASLAEAISELIEQVRDLMDM